MLTTSPNSVVQKKDLHIGGIGAAASAASAASGALATIADPLVDAADSWLLRARGVAHDTEDYVRSNPWAALAVVAALGVAAGYLLSRR